MHKLAFIEDLPYWIFLVILCLSSFFHENETQKNFNTKFHTNLLYLLETVRGNNKNSISETIDFI